MLAGLLSLAHSAPDSIAVVARVAPPSTSTVAAVDLEAAAIAAARWFSDVEVAADETMRAGLDAALRECATDNSCLAARLERAGVDRALYVVANVAANPSLLTVEVVDSARGEVVATSFRRVVGPWSIAVSEAVRDALSSSAYSLGARLSVDVEPPSASIRLEPDRPIDRGAWHVLEPGHYVISAEAPGYRSERREVDLVAGREESLDFDLDETSVLESWWLWTLVGVGVAGVAVGVAAAEWPRKTVICQSCEE